VRLKAPEQPAVEAEYLGWEVWDGVAWPSRLAVGDAGGRVRMTCVIRRAHLGAAADRGRVRLRLPDGVERFTREELLRVLERVSSSS
jgi:hypothetical protein